MLAGLVGDFAELLRGLPADVVLRAHAGATCALAGLIWLVQVAHYPLLLRVGPEAFDAYHRGHLRRITLVVGPLMLLETASALWILWMLPPGVAPERAIAGFGMVFLIWLSTGFLQVPLHGRLERGFDERAVRRLVATNWVRTLLWTARALLALSFL